MKDIPYIFTGIYGTFHMGSAPARFRFMITWIKMDNISLRMYVGRLASVHIHPSLDLFRSVGLNGKDFHSSLLLLTRLEVSAHK